MTRYDQVKADLQANPKNWLITGVAGFIGSNLLEALLKLDQTVVGLDNFATGYPRNLDEVQSLVTEAQWASFRFIEGDIRNLDDCREAVKGTDYVLHQAALGSVPRSIEDPIATNQANIDGFLNMLVAAKDEEVPPSPDEVPIAKDEVPSVSPIMMDNTERRLLCCLS